MKKVTVIWSSPNTEGLTASAKNQIMKGLEEAGVRVEEIHQLHLLRQHLQRRQHRSKRGKALL